MEDRSHSMLPFYARDCENYRLHEALAIHYELNPQFTHWNQYASSDAQALVKAHDLTHIIFGCDTSLLGEMRVQLWATYGVQAFALKDKFRFARNKEARVLLKNPVGYWAMLKFFTNNRQELSKVRSRAAYMSKPWRYFDEDRWMGAKVGEIQNEFGIQVI